MSRFRFLTKRSDTDKSVETLCSGFSIRPTILSALPTPSWQYSEVSLGKLGKWFWRVKKWKMTSTMGSLTSLPDNHTVTLGPGTLVTTGGATNELQLITNTFNSHSFSYILTTSEGSAAVTLGVALNIYRFQDRYFTIIEVGGGWSVDTVSFGIGGGLPTTGRVTVPCTVDGISVPLITSGPASIINQYTTSIGSIILEPAEYWTYDGIYSATSGNVNHGMNEGML